MVEKIIINPNKVRGYGNVLNVHSSTDYDLEDCTIESGTDTVNGATETVYTLTPTFSHSYSLAFGSSSYTQTGGSVSVSATLTDGGVAVSGATITFTGGSSTVTATTNSSGVATATVSFSSSGTCTATYGSVSDTASITVQSYLFYDACNSSSGFTNYGSSVAVRGSGASMSIEYNSTENAYKVSGSGNYYAMIPIPDLNDEDEYVISAEFKGQNVNSNGAGFCLDNRNDTTSYSYAVWFEKVSKLIGKQFNLNSDGTANQHTGLSMNANTYYRMELIVNGSSLTGKLYDGDTLLTSDSTTLTVNNKQVGIFLLTQNGTTNSACYVKNIKAEAL